MGEKITAAKAYLHPFEEPPISGTRGSGAVFFSGCNLSCVFCQNEEISHNCKGQEITPERLADIFLSLEQKGAHNINLVTPSHFTFPVLKALDIAKRTLTIPIVFNSSGYESVSTLKLWEGYVDIYLPDFKYVSSALSKKYSNAPDYFEFASSSILEMLRQVGDLEYNSEGILKKGLVIRHLILPNCYKDSIEVSRWISSNLSGDFLVSIMSQYTPNAKVSGTELDRRVSTFEYKKVLEEARALNLNGFMQQRDSAQSSFTPDFDYEGIF
ncbi:MAG: 4Fe-4S cluster-binding domain-containing protein [Ruminococcus sp.]|nr:4Fe-4S cluster-binding domain-containing protein [Ruminococcus sp.]